MKGHFFRTLPVALATSVSLRAGPCFVEANFVPPPTGAVIRVTVEFIDADDTTRKFGVRTRDVDGSTFFKEPITPAASTKRITIKFAPDVNGLKIYPSEITLDLSPIMHASTVTWIASAATRDDTYLQNVKAAQTFLIKKQDVEEALDHAAYAGAVASTANQKVEAARVEIRANLANNNPYDALTVFSKTSAEPNFEKADPSKQKVFVAEWFDVLELAAKGEGANGDKKTGLIFPSLPADSKLPQEFEKFIQVLARINPEYSEEASRLIPQQSEIFKSELAAKENVVRAALLRSPYKIPQ
jgi:hypothetical protein